MMVPLLLAMLQLPGSAFASRFSVPSAAPAAPAASAATVVDSARDAAASFNWVWRFYWEASVTRSLSADFSELRPPPIAIGSTLTSMLPNGAITQRAAFRYVDQIRRQYLHCHPDGAEGFRRIDAAIIESGVGKRAVCPSWDLSAERPPFDERLDIDADIRPELVPGLERARDELLAVLDRAARASPTDTWVAGQRVRFALDRGDTSRALAAARQCTAQPGWCKALEAYVRYGRHEIERADSMFQAAVVLLPATEHCAWTDLSLLLDADGAKAYARVPCNRRDSVNARIWWLADPMYSEPGNERRAEHYAREVDWKLRSTDTPSERWDMRDRGGGEAVREMLIRYGWPAYSYWAGHYEDEGHFGYLGISDAATMSAGIFATAEYPLDRAHTVPAWSAIVDPWHAEGDAWSLNLPILPKTNVVDVTWWPREHTVHAAGPLVQLTDYQAGLFRRDSEIELVVATDPAPHVVLRPYRDSIDGILIVSPAPDSIRVQRQRVWVASTAVMRTLIPASPQVIGVEYPQTQGKPSARTRFGVTPPMTLAAMAQGEIAISPPVLLQAPVEGETPETDPTRALGLMFGSTVFSTMGRVGVYWETYGVDKGDTVDVSLRVAPRRAPQGLLGRLGTRLHLLAAASDGIAVTWREPSPERAVTTLSGLRPIQARNVTTDLSRLAPGDYTLTVSVSRPGGIPVSAMREFTVLPH